MAGRKYTTTFEQHGLSKHPAYRSWCNMKARCENPNRPDYKFYGGRGITVCDQWRKSFVAFLADVGEKPGPRYSLDRIDNLRGYEPGNVRWATHTEQMRNCRKTNLTLADAEMIRKLRRWGLTYAALGLLYGGMTKQGIRDIVLGKVWKT